MWNVIGVHKALQSKQDWNTHRNTGSKLAGSTYKGFSLTEPFPDTQKKAWAGSDRSQSEKL